MGIVYNAIKQLHKKAFILKQVWSDMGLMGMSQLSNMVNMNEWIICSIY